MTATASTAPAAPGVRSWWGIPYATAERCRRPVLADFDPDRRYDRKGVAPVQPDSGDCLEADSGTGEDCLNLNVWAPAQPAAEALPVAVYVHGGGFEFGANTQTTSNAAGLAATGRVVGVSINYRLGALGAVSLSQYGGRLAEASNLFLQDIIAALTWVKQNIAAFGGDSGQVTVFGHSGGGYAAFGLLGASCANGLYRRLAGFSAGPSRIIPAWWVANGLDRFDPHTVDRVIDEVAGWRIPRSRARKIVDAYDQGGRTPAEVRAPLLTDYIFTLPAAPNKPTVTGVSATSCSTSPPASRPVCGPAVTDQPASGTVGDPPTSPALITRRSSTCSTTSPAPDGHWAMRNSAASPLTDQVDSCVCTPGSAFQFPGDVHREGARYEPTFSSR
ncbi:carboxylesterase family protein [Actinomadura opuntiae]|uniref:carboxylesterase family protein n=1 Tax=Actinomadura sp. OS1-43 TaxID=604315 RepID=UPI00255A791A|nr:carboxylesterase family protein [Actinomadura sp. OS1-43]MDL4812660.1 carboxylesterase family protein [Actinomadura sp. OS1-43]